MKGIIRVELSFGHVNIVDILYYLKKVPALPRANMTLASFDDSQIPCSDQGIFFLGYGSKYGKISPGSLCKYDAVNTIDFHY